METNKNQNPAEDEKSDDVKKIMEDLLAKSKNIPPKPTENEKPKSVELNGVENPKKYTTGEMWAYGGIGSLIAGIIGFFIGQSQGKKKAETEFDKIMQEYKEKTEKRLSERQQLSGRKEKKEKTKPVFRMG